MVDDNDRIAGSPIIFAGTNLFDRLFRLQILSSHPRYLHHQSNSKCYRHHLSITLNEVIVLEYKAIVFGFKAIVLVFTVIVSEYEAIVFLLYKLY